MNSADCELNRLGTATRRIHAFLCVVDGHSKQQPVPDDQEAELM